MKKTILIPLLVFFAFSPTALLADVQYYDTSGREVSETEYQQILDKWYEFIEAEKEKKRQAEAAKMPKPMTRAPVATVPATTGTSSTTYTPARRKSVSSGNTRTYPSDDLLPTPKRATKPKRGDKFTNKLRLLR